MDLKLQGCIVSNPFKKIHKTFVHNASKVCECNRMSVVMVTGSTTTMRKLFQAELLPCMHRSRDVQQICINTKKRDDFYKKTEFLEDKQSGTYPEDRLLLFARSLGPIGFGGAARESCGDVYPVGRAGRTGLN